MNAITHANELLTVPEGTEIGVSNWTLIDQDMITRFGELTRDIDPLHLDPEWAVTHGPFGGTTAYGFLTMSMLSFLLRDMLEKDLRNVDSGLFLNYGFERMRLISPVRVNKRIRGRFVAGGIREDKGGRRIKTIHATVEIEGEDRPALVADWLSAWVPPAEGGGTRIIS